MNSTKPVLNITGAKYICQTIKIRRKSIMNLTRCLLSALINDDEKINPTIIAIGVNICVITNDAKVRLISIVFSILPIFLSFWGSIKLELGLILVNPMINRNNKRYSKYARDGGP
jgi:hypothetical protein